MRPPAPLIEEILSPLVVGAAHQSHNVAAGMKVECAGFAHQLHARFRWRLVAFAAVARMAASDEVLPGGGTSARARDYMIKSQFSRRQDRRAILAGIAIAQQNVLTRQRPALMRNAAILQQSDHRRQAHCDAGRVQKVAILLFGHRNALQDQHKRATGRTDVNWFVRRVQHKDRGEQRVAVSCPVRSRWHKEASGMPRSCIVLHAQRHKVNDSRSRCFERLRLPRSFPIRDSGTLTSRCCQV